MTPASTQLELERKRELAAWERVNRVTVYRIGVPLEFQPLQLQIHNTVAEYWARQSVPRYTLPLN